MKVWIGRSVVDEMRVEASAYAPLETGGVLVGWRDGEDRIVVDAIGPGPLALHGRHAFMPDHRWQLAQLRQAFQQSGGDLDYLGDWHTHPGGIAQMSEIDRGTLNRLAGRVPRALMMIAAGGEDTWTFGAWMQQRGGWFGRTSPVDCEVKLFDIPESWPSRLR